MNTTITKIAWLCLAAIPASSPRRLRSRNGHRSASLATTLLTVKTAKGNVDVKLDDKTELTKNDQKAQRQDLIPGARVVVDIPEGNKEMLAHSVKIGTAAKTAVSHTHDSH